MAGSLGDDKYQGGRSNLRVGVCLNVKGIAKRSVSEQRTVVRDEIREVTDCKIR